MKCAVRWVLVCVLALAGCGGSPSVSPDATPHDAGSVAMDAGPTDSGVLPDSGTSSGMDAAADSGPLDAGIMDTGTSTITPDAGPSCPPRCDRNNGNADCDPCGGLCMLDQYNGMGHFGTCVF
jgi:hypothetical protein